MRPAVSGTASFNPSETLGLPQLLRLLDRPIAFHRCFVDLAGSITAALMLSQAIYWQQRTKDPDGWWYKTREEWREETGMSRWEQEEARKRLRRAGVLREERRGIPARLWYRVDEGRLLALLAKTDPPADPDSGPEGLDPAAAQMEGKPPTGQLKASHPDGGKTANWSATSPPTFKGTETTTETTTTTPLPLSSNGAATATDSARGGRGVEGPNAGIPGGDPAPAVTEVTTEEKAANGEGEIQSTAAMAERDKAPTEHRNPVSGRGTPDERRPELAFPAKLTESEYADIAAQVKPLPPKVAQQMLDVIEAKIKADQIRTSAASVLRGIVRKYKADSGDFDPSPGFRVADARHRRAEAENRFQRVLETRDPAPAPLPLPPRQNGQKARPPGLERLLQVSRQELHLPVQERVRSSSVWTA